MKIKIHKRKYRIVFEPLESADLLGECNYELANLTIKKIMLTEYHNFQKRQAELARLKRNKEYEGKLK